MKQLLTATLTSTFLLIGSASASALTTVLYSGAIGTPPNNRPGNQSWLYVPRRSSATPASTQTSDSLGTVFNSTSNINIESGYGWTATPLNSTTGYNLQFNLQLLQEVLNPLNDPTNPSDTNGDGKADRAGLSIIAISSDVTKSIELGFFVNRIWEQEGGATKPPRFTQAEGVTFDTRTSVNQYDLSILGNTYYLYANSNYVTPILTGSLRDYSAEVLPSPNPYITPNSIFIGDNTTAASAQFRVNQVVFTDSAIAPIPFAFNPLFGFGMFAVSRLRKAIAKKK
ncbi:hypothetical protein IQ250_07845 [Pseudanabaenaceae cyanobacterium LEGE 13415]|nr:hypothetical protein [Pseudanabaenaceae cyanobacterium LEGE 13415]